jgi:hypothetical protein
MRVGAPGREAEGAGHERLAHEGAHPGQVVGGGGLLAGSPLAHHVEAQRIVGHLRGDVDRVRLRFEPPEVVGKGLPAPVEPLVERRAGYLFHPLHEPHQAVLLPGAKWREAHPTVAHHHGGDAVPRRRGEGLVPDRLAVVVGM